ncbi:protein tyrosine kinase [Dictyocaulus viviparus]|uniref:Protein tyrosine kinase n=1 Tax=Dictyocaulus viviparus TaxID=29172 RepID=A0A0D8YF09_DICVI|nr:protein tyrosine kinase [Dictyocaulus viviparus]
MKLCRQILNIGIAARFMCRYVVDILAIHGICAHLPPPHPFCAVPPPMEQPHRDPRANLMHCEQWAARQFDQAVLPSLLSTPFHHVTRTVIDPYKQIHMKILKAAGISDKGERAALVNGVKILKEVTSYMEQFDRPIKKEKFKDNEGKEHEKHTKQKPKKEPLLPWTDCPEDEFCIVTDRTIEIDKNDLTQKGNKVAVAVKSLRLICTDKDQRLPWVAEAEMSHQLNHPNVVRFYGFTFETADSNILMVFEMMDKGALDSFCRKINYQISVNEMVDWLCQIARGMAHLHAQIPVIVHGDLAARNVLVCSHPIDVTRYVLKITDFGISKRTRRETFATYDDPNKIPFKWLPPEVLKSREMTPKADVWSYGVLVHELYGIGEPYGMMGPEKVIHALNDGHRFERQPKMPHFIYDVVLQCWRRLPLDRPHFREIELYLLPHYIENEATHMKIISERLRKQQEAVVKKSIGKDLGINDLIDRH